MPNFVVIYTHNTEQQIIKLYNELELKPYDTHIVLVEEHDKDKVEMIKHAVNMNLNHSGIIDSCIELNLYKTIHKMGGRKGDKIFFLRENAIIPHAVSHNVIF
ncbi:MAG TPA: hypothetical protein VI894_03555 [Candidatus Nanoarchaeia archaeon]|nr:hypothetical protein [Candidatus Nanoarchaeia archaeon]